MCAHTIVFAQVIRYQLAAAAAVARSAIATWHVRVAMDANNIGSFNPAPGLLSPSIFETVAVAVASPSLLVQY